jgi:hypothetical protein
MKKNLFSAFFFALGLITAVFHGFVFNVALSIGLSWTFAYVLPWIIVVLTSFAAAYGVYTSFKNRSKIWLPIVLFAVNPATHFVFNPVYEGDFKKNGREVNLKENLILSDVLRHKADFEGLVCVASPSCPYCIEAVKMKIRHLYQRGKIDILVFLGFGNDDIVKQFRVDTDAHELPIIINSNPALGIDIEESVIPVFIYIREQKIIHIWRNDQLGFPALDWIENRLA